MEYTIGTVQRGSFCCLILKTKNDVHTDLRGRVTLEQKKGNVLITDTFTVKKKYQEGDSIDGIAYDWYFICEHSRTVDRSEEIRANLEQIATDLEIETIEQDQELTEHDIAIMELQEQISTITEQISTITE